jgi:hypothetical protein
MTAIVASLCTAVALQLRWGYRFGVADQVVLLPKGIHRADPSSFADDWFVGRVAQPHWAFEQIVALGERAGALPAVMAAYYLASIAAFGLGCALAVNRLPTRRLATAAAIVTLGLLFANQIIRPILRLAKNFSVSAEQVAKANGQVGEAVSAMIAASEETSAQSTVIRKNSNEASGYVSSVSSTVD